MTAKKDKSSRLKQALLETANDMKVAGILDKAAYEKITMRHLGAEDKAEIEPLTAAEIRQMREHTRT